MKDIRARLHKILLDVWAMEHSYEVMHHGEAGKYADNEDLSRLMDHLIEDSTKHRRLVGDIFPLIGEAEPSNYHQKALPFNFDRATDCEALRQIAWVERKMLEQYDEALALVTKKKRYDSISPEDLADLRKHLEMLRRWEDVHLRMTEEMLKKKCR